MTAQTATAPPAPAPVRRRAWWKSIVHGTEDWITAIALAGLAGVPLLEIALRKAMHTGIYGASTITQHLTLIVLVRRSRPLNHRLLRWRLTSATRIWSLAWA